MPVPKFQYEQRTSEKPKLHNIGLTIHVGKGA
jgi:hypothetical protein